MFEELVLEDTCTYDFFYVGVAFFLKYFDISLTSLENFARIGGGSEETYVGLTISLLLTLTGILVT